MTPTSHTVTTLPHNTSSLETLAIQFADNDRSTSQSVPDHVDSSPQQLEDSLVQRQSEDMIGQVSLVHTHTHTRTLIHYVHSTLAKLEEKKYTPHPLNNKTHLQVKQTNNYTGHLNAQL